MVFFKLTWLDSWFISAFGRKKNLKVLFLHPMARSKMVHGGARFFLVHGGVDPSTSICPCMRLEMHVLRPCQWRNFESSPDRGSMLMIYNERGPCYRTMFFHCRLAMVPFQETEKPIFKFIEFYGKVSPLLDACRNFQNQFCHLSLQFFDCLGEQWPRKVVDILYWPRKFFGDLVFLDVF